MASQCSSTEDGFGEEVFTATNPAPATRASEARRVSFVQLGLRVLFVAFLCHLSTEVGFAHKLPPHNISALWPTSAILFSVLVIAPVRHWWLYILAAYVTSVVKD